jgi:hypothetical protein
MPTISRFFGIIILMYFDDHNPPHFHARYGEHEAQIAIATLQVQAGSLPNRALALTTEWASLHRAELWDNWERARNNQSINPIQPLE